MLQSKFISTLILLLASLHLFGCGSTPKALTDRERDGLAGSVKATLTEDVILTEPKGVAYESQQASSTAIYDEAGERTAVTPFIVLLPSGHGVTQHDPFFEPGGKRTTSEQMNNETVTSRFDENGNLIERVRADSTGRVIRSFVVNYEFDDFGNWIKRTITENAESEAKQPAQACYRRIVYFNNASNTAGQNQPTMIPASAKELKNPLVDDERGAELGRALFLQKCTSCHGKDGKAQTEFASALTAKPADLTSAKVRGLTEGEIYTVISAGIKAGGMPALRGRISDESIWQITRYVRRLSEGKAPDSQIIATAAASPSKVSVPPQLVKPGIARRYPFKGRIVSIEPEYNQVTIEHEDIPGYMDAMTMPFPLKDKTMLNKLKKDDRIEAILMVDDKGWRLENVVVK